ncbi:hypothetical protein RGQ29_007580 [Quercus rubra]|uniref:Scarecrow-like protein 6 n=1 Tax=Quercus rubra TaxID=3512 RepID=A0AAN7DXY5_QUERU|nr:hypothetical protein RGQ29_007580 [Quercus rubra]
MMKHQKKKSESTPLESMRGMPFQLQGKGVFEIASFTPICSWNSNNKKEELLDFANNFNSNNHNNNNNNNNNEPSSVLHMRRSPSPPTSASTLSSSFGGGGSTDNTAGGGGGVATTLPTDPSPGPDPTRKDEWASELQPIPSGLTGGGERCGLGGLEDWETMLSETAASPSQDHSLLRWIAGDVDDSSFGLKQLLQSGSNSNTNPLDLDGNAGLGIVDQGPGVFDPIIGGVTLPPGVIYQQQHQQFEVPDEKPQILNPQMLMNQQQQQQQQQQSQHPQSPNFFLPLPFAQQEQHLPQPQPKRQNSGGLDPITQIPKPPFVDPGHEFLLRKHQQLQPQHMGFSPGVQFVPQHLQQKPLMVPKQKMGPGEELAQHHHQQQQQQQQQQQLALLDQLYKAAECIGTGNFSHAQGILARLNHQLSPVGKPLHRAAFYFKEALQLLLLMNNPVTSPPPRSPTPFDVIFKMGAYKVFSEVSPLIQFVNFTCNQALLESLSDADRIHIVDFDIGFGAQWASFMQELPVRNRGAPSLKITAFASPSTHHPVELGLMRENLTQFANEIGISFELEVVNFDCLDQTSYTLPILRAAENEAVAVNFPIWSSSNQPAALPSLLRFVKQLSPKIMVSLDRGCDRTDLPFPQHVLQALQSYINLLESLDAVNVTSDAVNKIERFLLQPKIESTVLGRLRGPDKMPLWKTLFASAGFSPVIFSNFTETQAECVVKRTPVRGFHVEKRQSSLVLCWQRRELISASAWRC